MPGSKNVAYPVLRKKIDTSGPKIMPFFCIRPPNLTALQGYAGSRMQPVSYQYSISPP
jgi:hypothetical protein